MRLEDPLPHEGDDPLPSPRKTLTFFDVAGRILALILIVAVLFVALVLGVVAGVLALGLLMDVWPG